jgi:hypothetical protein
MILSSSAPRSGRFCAAVGGWLLLHIVAVALRAQGMGRLAVCLTAPAALIDLCIFASAAFVGFDWTLRLWAARSLVIIPALVPVLSARLGVRVRDLVRVWLLPLTATLLMLSSLRFIEYHQIAPGMVGVVLLAGAGAGIYCATFAVAYGMRGLFTTYRFAGPRSLRSRKQQLDRARKVRLQSKSKHPIGEEPR